MPLDRMVLFPPFEASPQHDRKVPVRIHEEHWQLEAQRSKSETMQCAGYPFLRQRRSRLGQDMHGGEVECGVKTGAA